MEISFVYADALHWIIKWCEQIEHKGDKYLLDKHFMELLVKCRWIMKLLLLFSPSERRSIRDEIGGVQDAQLTRIQSSTRFHNMLMWPPSFHPIPPTLVCGRNTLCKFAHHSPVSDIFSDLIPASKEDTVDGGGVPRYQPCSDCVNCFMALI